jgi:hypothetical protein
MDFMTLGNSIWWLLILGESTRNHKTPISGLQINASSSFSACLDILIIQCSRFSVTMSCHNMCAFIDIYSFHSCADTWPLFSFQLSYFSVIDYMFFQTETGAARVSPLYLLLDMWPQQSRLWSPLSEQNTTPNYFFCFLWACEFNTIPQFSLHHPWRRLAID